MESIKIIVLLSYLLSAFFGISGITMALLSRKKIQTKLNTATVVFLTGMLLMCFYDWFLYFANYKVLMSIFLCQSRGRCGHGFFVQYYSSTHQ